MEIKELRTLISDIDCYEAHIVEDENHEIVKRETLQSHTELTLKYFRFVWEEKQAGGMLDRLLQQIWVDITPEARSFLEDMIFGIPVFHDMGKINPEFQNHKLHNSKIKKSDIFACVAGRHSIISSVLYMDYYLEKLKDAIDDREEKRRLRVFLLFHAYIIERHHSDLAEFEKFLESLKEGRGKDIAEIFSGGKCTAWLTGFSLHERKMKSLMKEFGKQYSEECDFAESAGIYAYVRMIYSLLVASDYYATTEFMSGIQISQLGSLDEIQKWMEVYENTELMRKIRTYQKEEYPQDEQALRKERDINKLRTEMLCDAEKVLKEHMSENLFYLEAPTGSGKSNTALDLSFQMMKHDDCLKKIYYIYPFNTLVEQNVRNLKKIFGDRPDIFEDIAVVNSLTPIKMTKKAKVSEEQSEQTMYYQKALLDRQFLNYPMILSTHVSLFDTMFGDTKESAFGFHQLMNSVIVLDEIQSYKNTIWTEIIQFLKEFAYLFHMKVIIMSATLPNLDVVSENSYGAITLLENKEKYFSNPCFRERVHISYELMQKENIEEELLEHVKASAACKKKVLVEFIKKDTAYHFFERLKEDDEVICQVEYMSGDDSLMERSRILNVIKEVDSIILVSTQVIEAGVDIDMDIGYKNISKLDSEEQFLGRINRSCLRTGVVYFFKIDDGKRIYGEDIRIEKMYTLENEEMRAYLVNKEFQKYYERILQVLKANYNERSGEGGLKDFFDNEVRRLDWPGVRDRMRLIVEDTWSMSVYLARILEDENGNQIDGREVWRKYVELLNDFRMDFSKKRVELSKVTSQMNYFIYQIKQNYNLIYNDKVGEIFYIEEGEQYFDNGKLNREKIQGEIGEFVDFI